MPSKPKARTTKKKSKSLAVRDIVAAIEPLAPLHLAEDWDQVGLQVGRWDDPATQGLLCIDFSPAVLDEAVNTKCDFVVAYHPPMFKPLKRLVEGGQIGRSLNDWKQALILKTARKRISVYSPHTALDAVRGGVNDWLCDGLGEARFRNAMLLGRTGGGHQKVVVYVPRGNAADKVRSAMARAGAGTIGRYDHCSFNLDGVGTFRGGGDTQPAVGRPGVLETVEETRIEMICFADSTATVLDAIRAAHPYEEPAIDVFSLAPVQPDPANADGQGRWMGLKTPVTPEVLARRVKKHLGLKQVRLAKPSRFVNRAGVEGKVETVAVCAGAGGSLFDGRWLDHPDAYITGEMQHHQVLDLVQRGKVVILAGHTNTERPFLPRYREMIEGTDAGRIKWKVSEADVTPWVTV